MTDTLSKPQRRRLRFETLDHALQDAESLLAGGYRRVGNWSLGRICDHLSNGLTYSRDGFPALKSRFVRQLARTFFLRQILARKVTRLRFPAPIPTAFNGTDAEGVRRLATGVERFQRRDPCYAPHAILGEMTPQQWNEFHLWHCEHHLSFLLPERVVSEVPANKESKC